MTYIQHIDPQASSDRANSIDEDVLRHAIQMERKMHPVVVARLKDRMTNSDNRDFVALSLSRLERAGCVTDPSLTRIKVLPAGYARVNEPLPIWMQP